MPNFINGVSGNTGLNSRNKMAGLKKLSNKNKISYAAKTNEGTGLSKKEQVTARNIFSATSSIPDISKATELAEKLNLNNKSGQDIKNIIGALNFDREGIINILGS